MKPIHTVDNVDLKRFMGDWYVIASIPTFIETEAYNAMESYRLEDDGSVATTFRFNKGSLDGPEKVYTPRGFIRDEQSNAVWGMQFVWPFKAEYRIIFLTDDYSQTVIGRTKRDYVWIMSRNDYIPPADYEKILMFLQEQGYDISKLRKVLGKADNAIARCNMANMRVLKTKFTGQSHVALRRKAKELSTALDRCEKPGYPRDPVVVEREKPSPFETAKSNCLARYGSGVTAKRNKDGDFVCQCKSGYVKNHDRDGCVAESRVRVAGSEYCAGTLPARSVFPFRCPGASHPARSCVPARCAHRDPGSSAPARAAWRR